ncbi:MAG: hypothetical protein IJW88_09000 [Alistipes sp.]|nr:hypothetical protein [Alistipes sp.]
MKKLLLLSVVLLLGQSGICLAQRQKMTENYYRSTEYGAISFAGNKTYNYIVGADGKQLYDGPYSISCPQSSHTLEIWPYSVRLTGSYNLTTNHTKGNLNGAINSNYKIAVTKYSRATGNETINEYETMSGYFTNGIPNGLFKVNSSTSTITKLNATYKNGVLVGAYSCHLMDDRSLFCSYSGNLSSTGKFIGTWKYEHGINSGTMVFQNGVLITKNNSKNGKSTPPAISALAKQYAAGSITKKQLEDKGYLVITDSILLGEYACTCITGYSGVDFKELGGFYFKQTAVDYEYIDAVPIISDAGIEHLTQLLIDKYDNKPVSYDGMGGYIFNAETPNPYVEGYHSHPQFYKISGPSQEYSPRLNIYIPKEVYNSIMNKVDVYKQQHPVTLKEFVAVRSRWFGNMLTPYLEGKVNLGELTDEKMQTLQDEANFVFEYLDKNMKPCPNNENIVKCRSHHYSSQETKHDYYITKSSFAELDVLKDVKSEREKQRQEIAKNAIPLKEYFTKEIKDEDFAKYLNGTLEINQDNYSKLEGYFSDVYSLYERANKSDLGDVILLKTGYGINCYIRKDSIEEDLKLLLSPHEVSRVLEENENAKRVVEAFEYIKSKGRSIYVVYDSYFNSYIQYENESQYWQLEAEKILKPFCPLVAYEIIERTPTTITCKWSVKGKKKVITTYELVIKHQRGKLILDSQTFNINTAKVIN